MARRSAHAPRSACGRERLVASIYATVYAWAMILTVSFAVCAADTAAGTGGVDLLLQNLNSADIMRALQAA
ncbi:MAG: hypothetical protein FJY85_20195, partial [Deltaproteobacteria bacterium]|nr:hypothetical protein [Deltaproteobacteria bacterium]